MFNRIKKILSLLILLSFTFSISYADDQLDVKTYVNNMRSSSYASGILGDIFTKVFDTEGQIKDIFLSFVNTLTNGFMPLLSGGQLIDSPIYSTLGNVGIGTTILTEKLTILGGISITKDPDSGDDVGNRDYNDNRYVNETGFSTIFDSMFSSSFTTLLGGGTTVQEPIDSCAIGSSIREVSSDGTVICELDTVATGTCTGTDKVSQITATGGIICSPDEIGSGGITANTANYISKSNGTDLADSVIYENTGNIGIGTIGANKKLEVTGSAGYTNTTDMGLNDTDFASKKYVDDEIAAVGTGTGTITTIVDGNMCIVNGTDVECNLGFIKNYDNLGSDIYGSWTSGVTTDTCDGNGNDPFTCGVSDSFTCVDYDYAFLSEDYRNVTCVAEWTPIYID